jgi:hypothetical protein
MIPNREFETTPDPRNYLFPRPFISGCAGVATYLRCSSRLGSNLLCPSSYSLYVALGWRIGHEPCLNMSTHIMTNLISTDIIPTTAHCCLLFALGWSHWLGLHPAVPATSHRQGEKGTPYARSLGARQGGRFGDSPDKTGSPGGALRMGSRLESAPLRLPPIRAAMARPSWFSLQSGHGSLARLFDRVR